MIDDKVDIEERIATLRKRAAERCNVEEAECHMGHLCLQAMLDDPDKILQIDGATGASETYKSVARRACRLASAMHNFGLRPGDPVILMAPCHLDISIPYYACHFGGFSICAIDQMVPAEDIQKLFPYIQPKMVFCQKACEDKIKQAFKVNRLRGEIVLFDDKAVDMEAFIRYCNGTQVNYRPPVINQTKTMAWLMLTSGTTGTPKVSMISFRNLLNAMICWWGPFSAKFEKTLAMSSIQWLSALLYFSSTSLRGFTRVQSSAPFTPERLINIINTYKPNVTAWTPYLLSQFLAIAKDSCDLSSFIYIAIGGSAIEKPLLDEFRKKCSALLYVVYGMTELVVPVFSFSKETPYGASGKPIEKYKYKLMDENNQPLKESLKTGELWIKSKDFFEGYMNNPEETATMLTPDGWFKTGDMFFRDEQNYYFFVERKRLIIRHYGWQISPLLMEEIIKRHPGVADVCVVGIPNPTCIEEPVAVIMKQNGCKVEPKDIFSLIKENMTENKQLVGGLFFVDSFPVTPSGKVHRSKVRDLATTAKRILPNWSE